MSQPISWCAAPGRHDNRYLRYAINIPLHEVQQAHLQAKRLLLEQVEARSSVRLREDVFTIGFARRATPYKRHDLLLTDPTRLKDIVRRVGPLQVVYAGKAMIQRIFAASKELEADLGIVYLADYDVTLAKYLVADDESAEVMALYDKLERVILPMFYGQAPGYAVVMRSAVALNASFFNTQRVVSQYVRNAYNDPEHPETSLSAPGA